MFRPLPVADPVLDVLRRWPVRPTVPRFNKVSDTVYEGMGESMLASGVCTACCHNKGDKMEIKDGGLVWTAGTNAVLYPPCLAGKESMRLHLVKGGAPTVAEMER